MQLGLPRCSVDHRMRPAQARCAACMMSVRLQRDNPNVCMDAREQDRLGPLQHHQLRRPRRRASSSARTASHNTVFWSSTSRVPAAAMVAQAATIIIHGMIPPHDTCMHVHVCPCTSACMACACAEPHRGRLHREVRHTLPCQAGAATTTTPSRVVQRAYSAVQRWPRARNAPGVRPLRTGGVRTLCCPLPSITSLDFPAHQQQQRPQGVWLQQDKERLSPCPLRAALDLGPQWKLRGGEVRCTTAVECLLMPLPLCPQSYVPCR